MTLIRFDTVAAVCGHVLRAAAPWPAACGHVLPTVTPCQEHDGIESCLTNLKSEQSAVPLSWPERQRMFSPLWREIP